jgi:hypothetical protein
MSKLKVGRSNGSRSLVAYDRDVFRKLELHNLMRLKRLKKGMGAWSQLCSSVVLLAFGAFRLFLFRFTRPITSSHSILHNLLHEDCRQVQERSMLCSIMNRRKAQSILL